MEKLNYKVVIIGAGAAGIGNGFALMHLGLTEKDFIILEKDDIGSSFTKWPEEMRFITPSFIGNQFGAVDLNAITHNTSPAFTVHKEHPSGKEYAEYLKSVVTFYKIPVKTGTTVKHVEKNKGIFYIDTGSNTYCAEYIIWCGGEFQYPKTAPFEGGQYCIHTATLNSYKKLEGETHYIIGGYESGIDAAVNLSKQGKKSIVLDANKRWEEFSSDPSRILSTYTYERLQNELPEKNIQLVDEFRVKKVEKNEDEYKIISTDGQEFRSTTPPLLCAGFTGSVSIIEDLFEYNDEGDIELTKQDESTITKNLFLSGPMVRQTNAIFCFIYKFRQRFPIIAEEIGKRMNVSTQHLDAYKKANMYMDDLSCCDEECTC